MEKLKKSNMIKKIQSVISEYGRVTTGELELDSSPMIGSLGGVIFHLIEGFNLFDVDTTIYDGEVELYNFTVNYVDLPEEVIDEIFSIILDYEAEQDKTYKRMED